jgi:hypothetical protein
MVEAGGVGISMCVENTQLIDFPTLSKRQKLRKRVQLEHNWNIAFSSPQVNLQMPWTLMSVVGAV